MRINRLHAWKVSVSEAKAIQEKLRDEIRLTPLKRKVRLIAAADVAYAKAANRVFAAVVTFRYPELEKVEEVCVGAQVFFPYISGLLTFREGPALERAFAKLTSTPDLILFDGQGIAHPRGLGLASHMGLFLDCPAVGCAKSRLTGSYGSLGEAKGDCAALTLHGTHVGYALRSRAEKKPIFVSPGHMIDCAGSLQYVISCLSRYRVPEPIRQAHLLATRMRDESS